MYYKIEIGLISLMLLAGNEILATLVALTTLIYYGSMLKVNVIDKHHKGSWRLFIKAILNKFR